MTLRDVLELNRGYNEYVTIFADNAWVITDENGDELHNRDKYTIEEELELLKSHLDRVVDCVHATIYYEDGHTPIPVLAIDLKNEQSTDVSPPFEPFPTLTVAWKEGGR